MDTGTIKKKMDKGFGFITPSNGGADLFFHISGLVEGLSFDSLHEGQAVTYTTGMGPKGAKAEQVNVA